MSDLSDSELSQLSIESSEIELYDMGKKIDEKIKDLNSEIHWELASPLIEYGEALFDKAKSLGDAENAADDFEISWEIFEQARLCLESGMSRVHVRLAELAMTQHNIELAIDEYKKAMQFYGCHETFKDEQEKLGFVIRNLEVLLSSKRIEAPSSPVSLKNSPLRQSNAVITDKFDEPQLTATEVKEIQPKKKQKM
jgi:hypothetical protein